MNARLDAGVLNTLFHECRQCGTCCRKYRKVLLQDGEAEFIRKMGGHVGVSVSMEEIRQKGLKRATEEAESCGKTYMIHPDEKGCVFLEVRNGKHYCRIYHYRPKTCRGFRCNLADGSFLSLFAADATTLLGQDRYGLPINRKG